MPLAQIVKIDAVENHFREDASHLSVMTIGDKKGVSMKVGENGDQHRYKPGDLVVAVFEGAVLPEWLLKQGFWNDEKNIGSLPGGKKGNRTKSSRFKEQLSEFIMFPVKEANACAYLGDVYTLVDGTLGLQVLGRIVDGDHFITRPDVHGTADYLIVNEGDDVATFLGIEAHVA